MYQLIKKIKNKYSLNGSRIERKIKININQINLFKDYFYTLGFFKKYPDQTVESIYFDDKNLNFAKSNINGDLYRVKPRIRWYNNNSDKLNHEFKIKIGFNGFKSILDNIHSNALSFQDKIKLTKKFYKDEFNIDLSEVISIKYNRSYFQHSSGLRMTIDKSIISKKINSNRYFLMPYEVIEFKYSNHIDEFFRKNIYNKFFSLPLRMTKCSKYVESLIRLI